MKFHVMTLFPEMIMDAMNTSIIGRAIEKGQIEVEAINIRDYTNSKQGRVDDYIYGGGAGLLMQCQPIYDCYQALCEKIRNPHPRTIYLTPQGPTFTQKKAHEFAEEEDLVLLCGHYEGVDERVLEEIVTDYVSIGDYVLTGGELAAMVVCDAVARLVPGVLHNDCSAETESFETGLLEYPQYTRPEVWNGKQVPPILLSGDHAKVDKYRYQQSLIRTAKRRPDLLEQIELSNKDLDFIENFLQSESESDMI